MMHGEPLGSDLHAQNSRLYHDYYRVSHVLVDLGWVDLDFGSSPGWWAATVATYCPSRLGELPKFLFSKPMHYGTPKSVNFLY